MQENAYPIAEVERDTGLSKDVLRAWERRYGFPSPWRDANDERRYPASQIERLRQIKRLLDLGHRPGKLLAASESELAALLPALPARQPSPALAPLLAAIHKHDSENFQLALRQKLLRDGLANFVTDTVAPLAEAVGDAWARGELAVHEEHLFSELIKRALRQAIAALPVGHSPPRIVLTTPPGEQHTLGLLMVEALWTLEDASCLALGKETPLPEIALAAAAHRADVVALSLSAAYPLRQILPTLNALRAALPGTVELWIGGAAIARLSPPVGIRLLPTLSAAQEALADWRRT